MFKERFGQENANGPKESIFDRPKGSEDLEAELDQVHALELHVSNLYDENESRGGEKVDDATGKPFDNTTVELEGIQIKDALLNKVEDPEFADDAAAKWLREHDPNWREKN